MRYNSNWLQGVNELDPFESSFLKSGIRYLLCLSNKEGVDASWLQCELTRLIADIDDMISSQLNAFLHHKTFQQMEARWRSLFLLSSLPLHKSKVKIKLLDMNWSDISNDLNQSYSVQASQLYNKIGNLELNLLGGEPFGTICIDHFVSMELDEETGLDDIYTLDLMAKLGEILLCPFVLSVDDHFFSGTGAEWIADTKRINKILQHEEYEAWQNFRLHPASKFIGLVIPKVLIRQDYKNHKAKFIFNESHNPLFGNAVFAFAATLLIEFQRVNWFGFLKARNIKGNTGAIVNNDNAKRSAGYLAKPKTDIKLNDTKAKFYSEQGFIPLTCNYLTEKVYLYGNNSVFNANGIRDKEVLSQLQITLLACRIAHYLKAQSRNMIASTMNANECQNHLQRWIEGYTSNSSTSDEAVLAQYPLSKAKISVEESPNTQSFHCELRMVPQYHYDALAIEVFLTTKFEKGEK